MTSRLGLYLKWSGRSAFGSSSAEARACDESSLMWVRIAEGRTVSWERKRRESAIGLCIAIAIVIVIIIIIVVINTITTLTLLLSNRVPRPHDSLSLSVCHGV